MSDVIKSYADSLEKQHQLYRRSLVIVVIAQLFGGAGLAAGVTVGALIAQDMLGTDNFAGIPSALLTIGSAVSALLVGRLSQRYGRRAGLATGFIAGGIGAIGIVIAAVVNNLALLFASMLVYGAGTSTNLQARYAGTDLAKPAQRARAISVAMVATTFGAVTGPNLVDVMGRFAASLGIPALAGPFVLAAAAFLMAGFIFWALLRPDPFMVAKAIAEGQTTNVRDEPAADPKVPAIRQRGIMVGTSVMVFTQIVMVAIMTMTPVHMKHHGHSLGEVGMVIGFHIAAMYLPSLVTGVLVDKLGHTIMSYASGVTLLLAGIVAAAAPGDSMFLLIVALSLLGLGWNFGLISGTAQIIEATPVATRAKTQGTVDVLIALAGASGGALSGVVVANASFTVLALGGSILSLLLIPIVIGSQKFRLKETRERDAISEIR
ncbi:MFS transporter [Cohnella pontilimi]|uniref:MFS transporter n=1 Tax=Cohnella pontilimi TaxID=2564100 RepID=UPI001FE63748|nr:MFS transporter [Cohnella pontilimi]